MSGRVVVCCAALFLFLTSASAVKRLYCIDDLDRIVSARSVPEHSLVLLRWFANAIEIDSNNYIWLNFDPNQRDYGSHYYGNYGQLLTQPLQGHQYFTIGNVYQSSAVKLPPSVIRAAEGDGNRLRIIVSVRGPYPGCTSQRIDRVYLTQHMTYQQGADYDPAHTYEISTNLLREMRQQRWMKNALLICFVLVLLVIIAFMFLDFFPNLSQTKSRWQ